MQLLFPRLVVVALAIASAAVFTPLHAAEPLRSEFRYTGPDGEQLPFRSDEEVLEFLRTAKIVSVKAIPVGVTMPRKVLLEKNGIRAHAVFRDVRVIKERVHLDDGSFVLYLRDDYRSEVVAYHLARLLRISGIPPVVERRVRNKPGSLQLWIENAMTEEKRHDGGISPPQPERWRRQIFTIRIFDNLINNNDRNLGNMLIDPDWNVWMIDHTRSFGREHVLIEPENLNRCPPWLWEQLTSIDDQTLVSAMRPYLGRFEMDAMLARRRKIVETIRQQMELEGESKVLFGGYDDPVPASADDE
jgi:hypothetical protein